MSEERPVKTLAGRVRDFAVQCHEEGRDFGVDDIAEALMVQTYKEKRRLGCTLRDLMGAGEVVRLERGRYRYVLRDRKPTKEEIMWWHLQQGPVDIEYLIRMADVTADYAQEWLNNLLHLGVVRRLESGKHQLLQRLDEMPKNEVKTDRLRRIRRIKKEARAQLDKLGDAVQRVTELIDQIDED